jgi:hypothetical protein
MAPMISMFMAIAVGASGAIDVFWVVDARWVAGGVGGFLFDVVVLRTNFWINPPLRWYLLVPRINFIFWGLMATGYAISAATDTTLMLFELSNHARSTRT